MLCELNCTFELVQSDLKNTHCLTQNNIQQQKKQSFYPEQEYIFLRLLKYTATMK